MKNNTIKCFLASADCQSFAKAAGKLYMTRQAVSKQIISLENEYGTPLFLRARDALELTEAGKILYDCFHKMDKLMSAADRQIAQLTGAEQKSITISVFDAVDMSDVINPIIVALQHEGYDVTFSRFPLHEAGSILQNGKTDVLISYSLRDWENYPEWNLLEFMTVPMMLVVWKDHPKNSPNAVFTDFQSEPLIVWKRPNMTAEESVEISLYHCRELGFEPNGVLIFEDMETADNAAECGNGVCACSGKNKLVQSSWVKTYPMNGRTGLMVAWKKASPKLPVKRFVELLKEGERRSQSTRPSAL